MRAKPGPAPGFFRRQRTRRSGGPGLARKVQGPEVRASAARGHTHAHTPRAAASPGPRQDAWSPSFRNGPSSPQRLVPVPSRSSSPQAVTAVRRLRGGACHRCMGGSVVEFSPATREARVRFPAHAALGSPFGPAAPSSRPPLYTPKPGPHSPRAGSALERPSFHAPSPTNVPDTRLLGASASLTSHSFRFHGSRQAPRPHTNHGTPRHLCQECLVAAP